MGSHLPVSLIFQISKKLKDIPIRIQSASLKERRKVVEEILDVLSFSGEWKLSPVCFITWVAGSRHDALMLYMWGCRAIFAQLYIDRGGCFDASAFTLAGLRRALAVYRCSIDCPNWRLSYIYLQNRCITGSHVKCYVRPF